MAEQTNHLDELDQAVHSFDNRFRVILQLAVAMLEGHPNDLTLDLPKGISELYDDFGRVRNAAQALVESPDS